jgi:fatty acid-binding protein DegV
MKKTVGLVVDSTFGLEEKFVKEEDIIVVPLKVMIEDQEFVDGKLDPKLVVKAMEEKKTSKNITTFTRFI